MRQQYKEQNFQKRSLILIQIMNAMLQDYRAQGYVVTVRQLYYQLVSQDVIPNTEKSYNKVKMLINDARLAGLMDWDMIEDRTRSFERRSRWDNPVQYVQALSRGFHVDMWDNQDTRVFCIVEKEALAGVLVPPTYKYDVPLLAARGYPSVTVVREFVKSDLLPAMMNGQNVVVLHLGDHDPSGIDMTRDLQDRIELFSGEYDYMVRVDRIALSMDQIDDQQPPPNPAKQTDSRFKDYEEKYGDQSWELDALTPSYLNDLVENHITGYIDEDKWEEKDEEREEGRRRIRQAAEYIEKQIDLDEAKKNGKS